MNVFLALGFTCALLTSVSTQECRSGCVHGICERAGECRCRSGWRGVACDRCGCAHGSCEESGQCVCERGWTGARCDRDISLCSSKPCLGNSSCVEMGDDFICICSAGFTGKHCHLKNTSCSPDGAPCQNGGTCVAGSEQSSCICPSGFLGRFCDTSVCDPNPCQNDGVCVHDNLKFTCVCAPAFSGPVCSLCAGVQCTNGGTCFNHTHCICPPGFSGSSCDLHIKLNPRFKAAVAGHTLHKSHAASSSLDTQNQIICFVILGLLTCLVVLITAGIIFHHRCEAWMANVKYSQLLHQHQEHTINIILPEKIKLSDYGHAYASI